MPQWLLHSLFFLEQLWGLSYVARQVLVLIHSLTIPEDVIEEYKNSLILTLTQGHLGPTHVDSVLQTYMPKA